MTRWERIGVALWLAGCLLAGVALAHAVTVPGPSRHVFSSQVLLPRLDFGVSGAAAPTRRSTW